jgi:hypothetical protein
MNTSTAAVIFAGVSFLALAVTVTVTAQGAFSRFDRAERLVSTLPPILDKANATADKLIAAGDRLKITATEASASIPTLGSKFGTAGSNALKAFAKGVDKSEESAK